MHRRRKILTVIITIILGFSILFSNNTIEAVQNQPDSDFKPVQINSHPKLLDDLTDTHFTIEGSADLDYYSGGFGTGTPGDPYIISGFRINASGIPEGIKMINSHGLYVDFFNNTILGGDNAAIAIENATSNTVQIYGNFLYNATCGIEFIDTDDHYLFINQISGCLTGLRIAGDSYEAHNNTFENCDIGIEVENAQQALLHNNTMIECGYGIYSINCTSGELNTNIITGSIDAGIYDRVSDSFTLNNNYFYDNYQSIVVNRSTNAYVVSNHVFNSINDGITLYETEGYGVWSNTLFGCGFNIYDRNMTRAATLVFHNTNNYVNGRLVHFYHSIELDSITEDLGQIIMYNCSYIDLGKLNCSDSAYGISLFSCKDFYIYDCEFYNIKNGFVFYDVDNIEIDNCTVEGGFTGLSAFSSINLYIYNCNISENSNVGIFLHDVVTAELRINEFINNTNYGIALDTCSDVIVYHNDFIDNGNGSLPQAADFYGSTNFWYSETLSEGNFWKDYSGVGTYLIHCQFDDIFDLFPSGPIIISEFKTITSALIILGIISFVSVLDIYRKRR